MFAVLPFFMDGGASSWVPFLQMSVPNELKMDGVSVASKRRRLPGGLSGWGG
jgi:hypothetical protein